MSPHCACFLIGQVLSYRILWYNYSPVCINIFPLSSDVFWPYCHSHWSGDVSWQYTMSPSIITGQLMSNSIQVISSGQVTWQFSHFVIAQVISLKSKYIQYCIAPSSRKIGQLMSDSIYEMCSQCQVMSGNGHVWVRRYFLTLFVCSHYQVMCDSVHVFLLVRWCHDVMFSFVIWLFLAVKSLKSRVLTDLVTSRKIFRCFHWPGVVSWPWTGDVFLYFLRWYSRAHLSGDISWQCSRILIG